MMETTYSSIQSSYLPYVEIIGKETTSRLTDLASEDVSIVVQVYRAIRRVQELRASMVEATENEALRRQLAIFAQPHFITAVQSIGLATLAVKEATPPLRHLFHELRGGRLASLVLYATLMEKRPNHSHYLFQAITFAQDHLHTMHQLLPELLHIESMNKL